MMGGTMMWMRSMMVLAAAASLAACATTDDPAKGGFFSGVKNLSDGTYDRRVDEKQKTLENEQDVKLQQTRALQRANEESADIKAQRAQAEARYASFQGDLDKTRSRLNQAEAANSTKKAQVAALNKQIDSLQSSTRMVQQDSFTPDADKQKRLDSLKRELDALNREVDMLIGR